MSLAVIALSIYTFVDRLWLQSRLKSRIWCFEIEVLQNVSKRVENCHSEATKNQLSLELFQRKSALKQRFSALNLLL